MMAFDRGLYSTPECCGRCHSVDILIGAMIMNNGAIAVQVHCNSCGAIYMLPKAENLAQRTNNVLSKWAQKVKIRDGEKCVICGSKTNLEAHHIVPVAHTRAPEFMYNPGNGVTLCQRCHYLVHHKEAGEQMSMFR